MNSWQFLSSFYKIRSAQGGRPFQQYKSLYHKNMNALLRREKKRKSFFCGIRCHAAKLRGGSESALKSGCEAGLHGSGMDEEGPAGAAAMRVKKRQFVRFCTGKPGNRFRRHPESTEISRKLCKKHNRTGNRGKKISVMTAKFCLQKTGFSDII